MPKCVDGAALLTALPGGSISFDLSLPTVTEAQLRHFLPCSFVSLTLPPYPQGISMPLLGPRHQKDTSIVANRCKQYRKVFFPTESDIAHVHSCCQRFGIFISRSSVRLAWRFDARFNATSVFVCWEVFQKKKKRTMKKPSKQHVVVSVMGLSAVFHTTE